VGLIVLVIIVLLATLVKLFSQPSGSQVNELPAESVTDSANVIESVESNESVVSDKSSQYVLKNGETLIQPENIQNQQPIMSSQQVPQVIARSQPAVAKINSDQPRQLAELSAQELNKIPSLSLESHLYSTVAEYSSVVINGQNYSEGDLLSLGVVLNKINANGIVVSVDNILVELPKGITWMSTSYAK
jgi:general secretion pathway protein B